MMLKIKCPECNTEGNFSLADSSYKGPYKCWKCKALFTIEIKDNELQSLKPLSQEELDKQQEEAGRQQEDSDLQREIEALKAKFRRS
jgi:phage FluMu protein Com